MTQDLPSPLIQTAADPGASTEQRLHALEAQVALLEEATRQATVLFEHLPTPALLLDAQGRVVSGNLRSYELLGASPGTLLGRRFAFFVHSASQGTFTALLDRAQQSGERGESLSVQVGKRRVSGRVRQHQRRRFHLGKGVGEIRQREHTLDGS